MDSKAGGGDFKWMSLSDTRAHSVSEAHKHTHAHKQTHTQKQTHTKKHRHRSGFQMDEPFDPLAHTAKYICSFWFM